MFHCAAKRRRIRTILRRFAARIHFTVRHDPGLKPGATDPSALRADTGDALAAFRESHYPFRSSHFAFTAPHPAWRPVRAPRNAAASFRSVATPARGS